MEIEEIARIAYEINIALLKSYGDRSQPPWELAPEWIKAQARAGVDFHLANPDASPSFSHDIFVKKLIEGGWRYGENEDVVLKTHPRLMPFAELPQAWRTKDWLLRQVVRSLAPVADHHLPPGDGGFW